MSRRLDAVRRGYVGTAITLLNVLVAFAVINLAALVALPVLDYLWPRQNAVAERHGSSFQSELYPDLSPEDVGQLLRETWTRKVVFEPYTMFKEPPSQGRFLNVDPAGFRRSKEQGPWPVDSRNYNVFLFGGSTTFSYGLPDDQALGAAFQEALSTRIGRPMRVYNFGAGAYQSTQERVLFQELIAKGHRPDLAIFVDGLNDFAFPHVPMDTDTLRAMLEDSPIRRVAWLGAAVVRHVPVVKLGEAVGQRWSPREVPDQTAPDSPSIRELTAAVAARYVSNKRQIDSVAREYGIQAIFVWQPVPFYKYDPAFHPFKSEANRNLAAGYAQFQAALPEGMGDNFIWCADMQEGIKERLYVDAVHYTARMNRRLATAVFESMLQRHLVPPTG